jgi:sterol desaturase/sphingolipid hydroxylase (fatty acid hydroxylase superfamily)
MARSIAPTMAVWKGPVEIRDTGYAIQCRRVSNLVLYAIPVFVASVVIEALLARRHRELKGYELRDSAASMTLGLANVIVNGLVKLLPIPLFAVLYEHRIVDIGRAWWAWIVLLFAEDLCYYWFHRVHHEVRLLWACHVNHHSSQYFNLSTALRQPLLTPLSGPLFWTPLPLIGFSPQMVLLAQAWSLIYQFWIHTELVGQLGPLEWVLNTPSHHRVHHAKDLRYLDKNHGGIFIFWDRLFGTFAPETDHPIYGLTKDIQTFQPLRIAFHEFAAIGRDVRRAPTLLAKLGYVFAPPGWSHDGSSRTATQLQRES